MLRSNSTFAEFIVGQQAKILDRLGVAQHHDAITGTSVRRVSDDYYLKLQQAQDELNHLNFKVLQQVLESTNKIELS